MVLDLTAESEPQPRSAPELIVVMRPEAGVRVSEQGLASTTRASLDDVDEVLRSEGVTIEPLFGQTESDTSAAPDMTAEKESDLSLFYHVPAPEEKLESIAERLRACDAVDTAYVKPPAEPPQMLLERRALNEMSPTPETPPAATPDFTSRQSYLFGAPVGIDATYAWTLAGGRGANIRVIDCEWGWNLSHEDLQQNSLGLICGTNHSSTSHGTAVMGEIGADHNGFGANGIAPDAALGASSFANQTSATAIKCAADSMTAGDIILLEIHRAGPSATGAGQKGYIAIEWWPDDFLAIRYAVAKGIIVVEAAGNGWEDLDAAVYDVPSLGFPTWWRNPFRLSNPGSGAVLVGAGSPPSPTHGRTTSPWGQPYVDRARAEFSNWGARVDAQGWGWEVTATGYGDLQGGDPGRWYTDTFSGTSSASPIVVGALACTQGVLKAKGMPLMTSERARQLLRLSGSPQQGTPDRPVTQRVGNRPNLRQLIPAALRQWVYNATIQYTYAATASQSAWAFITGLGWRQIATGAPDAVTNVFSVACEAQATGKPVHVYIDDVRLYILWAP